MSRRKLLKDIEFLQTFIKFNNFGIIKDITLNGKHLKKNETRNATIFKIPVDYILHFFPTLRNYGTGDANYERGGELDVHLSVFEDRGVITKHVTFVSKKLPVRYYYGKHQNDSPSATPVHWTTPERKTIPDDIKSMLVGLYNTIKPVIRYQRENSDGTLTAPKTLSTLGTGSSRPVLNEIQKQNARAFYAEHGVPPPSPMNISNSGAHGITPKRLF